MKRLQILLATLLCLACATLPGQRTQTSLDLSGGYTRADYQATCSNQRQIVDLAQGTLAVRHERENGLALGGNVGAQRETLVAAQNVPNVAIGDTHWNVLGGAWVGWHGRWWASDLGLSLSGPRPTPIPYFAVRGGDLSLVWGEAQIGTVSPTSDPRMAAIGVGFRIDAITLHPYIAVAAPLLSVFPRNEIDLANGKAVAGLDVGGNLSDRIGFGLRLMGGETAAGYLTLSLLLDSDERADEREAEPLPQEATGALEL